MTFCGIGVVRLFLIGLKTEPITIKMVTYFIQLYIADRNIHEKMLVSTERSFKMKIEVKKPKRDGVLSWPIWEKEISRFAWHYDETEECYLL